MRGKLPLPALFAVTVWGGSFVVTKLALASFTPFGLVALRFALGAAALQAVLLLRGGALLPERADRGRVALLGLILAAHIGLQTYGLGFTLATHAGWIVCFTSVAIALGAQFFLGQRLRARGWLGVALAIGGVWIVTRGSPAELVHAGRGDLLQLTGSFTWASYTLLGARAVAGSGVLRVTAGATAVAAALHALLAWPGGYAREFGPLELGALVYLGLVSSAAAFLAWYHAQRTHGSQRTAATLYLEPFVTALVARSAASRWCRARCSAAWSC
jgi:drug/metabolite transporter (DMT)-like permease